MNFFGAMLLHDILRQLFAFGIRRSHPQDQTAFFYLLIGFTFEFVPEQDIGQHTKGRTGKTTQSNKKGNADSRRSARADRGQGTRDISTCADDHTCANCLLLRTNGNRARGPLIVLKIIGGHFGCTELLFNFLLIAQNTDIMAGKALCSSSAMVASKCCGSSKMPTASRMLSCVMYDILDPPMLFSFLLRVVCFPKGRYPGCAKSNWRPRMRISGFAL
jgi:hypothetical protein